MSCDEIQQILKQNSPNELPQKVKEHLSTCQVCSSFASFYYFTDHPSQLELFPPVDLKHEILYQLEKNKIKTRIMKIVSIAASILLGLFFGLLLQYYFVNSNNDLSEKTYQFTDVLLIESYHANTAHHE
ncbi:MAG: hypothetical protein N2Z72_01155 [Bacteroidales bacterium]|nr:hypothetical protein [Bacteroidales bacterium]